MLNDQRETSWGAEGRENGRASVFLKGDLDILSHYIDVVLVFFNKI